MEDYYNLLQTTAIFAHFIIFVLTIYHYKNRKNSKFIIGIIIQVILVSFLFRDLTNQWLINKQIGWFVLDYLLAIYFYLNIKENNENYRDK